jgi:transposase
MDMRCGRHRLASYVKHILGFNPLSGDYFVFLNKRSNSVKVLYFDNSGYAVWHKVLEGGTFSRGANSELSVAELLCLLEGIEIKRMIRKHHFSLA